MATTLGPTDYRHLKQLAYEMAMDSHEPMTLTESISNQNRWLVDDSDDTQIDVGTDGRFMLAAMARGNSIAMGEIIANFYETPMPHEDRQRKIKQCIETFAKEMTIG